MLSNWLYVDTNFPTFTGQESTESKVSTIQNYLFMLVEQLRYSLHNLDAGNMNPSALDRYANGLTDPIYRQLSDNAGNITQLQIDAKGLQMQITSNAGDIHNLSVTAGELASQIADANGNISSLQQTASEISSTVANQGGDISQLQQTASSISSTVSSQGGQISSLQQTASSISSQVSGLSGDVSRIRQTVNSITLSVTNGDTSSTIGLYRDGVLVSSQNIVLNGTVTFTDLSGNGRPTVINGGIIDTNTLRVNNLYGQYVYLRDAYGAQIGTMTIGASSSSFAALELRSGGAMRLVGQGGDVYIDSYGGYVTLSGGMGNTCMGNFYPTSAGVFACGIQAFPWSVVYSETGVINGSDRRVKQDADYDMSRYSAVFDALRPCSFRFIDGESGRRHTGLMAQEVLEAVQEAGLTSGDLAAYCAWTADDAAPESDEAVTAGCGLRYEEFIALLIYEVQTLKKQVKKLGGASAA